MIEERTTPSAITASSTTTVRPSTAQIQYDATAPFFPRPNRSSSSTAADPIAHRTTTTTSTTPPMTMVVQHGTPPTFVSCLAVPHDRSRSSFACASRAPVHQSMTVPPQPQALQSLLDITAHFQLESLHAWRTVGERAQLLQSYQHPLTQSTQIGLTPPLQSHLSRTASDQTSVGTEQRTRTAWPQQNEQTT